MSAGLSSLLGGYGSDDSDEPKSTSTIGRETPRGDEGPGAPTSGRTESRGAENPSSGTGSDGDDSESGSDSGDSEKEKEEVGKTRGEERLNCSGGGSGLLPSVDDLFSNTGGPDFLSTPGAGKEFVVEAMRKEKAEKNNVSTSSSTLSSANPGGSSNLNGYGNKRVQGAGAATAVGVKRPKGGSAGPAGPPADKKGGARGKDATDKVTAKERVKGQRLKGQSGIGSDFRVWKSDLEMTMRQQYD